MGDDDERELLLYFLRIQYTNQKEVELIDEQQENINIIKRVIDLDPELSEEDRNILTLAYKNPVTSRRNTLRTIEAYYLPSALEEQQQENSDNTQRIKMLKEFEQKMKNELEELCIDLVKLVDEKILSRPSVEAEDRVFYEKMKGDFYRYICENRPREEVEEFVNKAKQCYNDGLEIGRTELTSTSPTFLGLVLNYTVFLYDIMDQKEEATELSKKTFTDTADIIDTMDDTSFTESSMILSLLQENYHRWIQVENQEI